MLKVSIRRRRTKTPPKANYGIEQHGQEFTDAIKIKTEKKFESDEEVEPEPVPVVKVEKAKEEVQVQPLPAEYDLQQQGQKLEGSAKLRKTQKFDSESDKSSIHEEVEPPSAAYDMERAGQFLEGKASIRTTKKFDSESSSLTDEEGVRQLGGITHVTLIKKESAGRFELTIECPRIGEPVVFKIKERPALKFENMEFMKTIERESKIIERAERTFMDKNYFKGAMNILAQGTKETTLMIALQKEKKYKD
uniref:Uncharacterized protein n=1 Tax=Panagrolaimus sp. JU765 TaxID=591449 RepID=A0AC34RMQ1_9BILA